MSAIDASHRADLRSWVDSANDAAGDFPIQNLPFGVFRRHDNDAPSIGVAIGERILDVVAALRHGLLDGSAREAAAACSGGRLNPLMALGSAPRRALRGGLVELLREDSNVAARARGLAAELLVTAADVELLLPAEIGDYTDFYASIHHATNVGSMFRPDNPLLPNYKYVPIGYHGRASSIGVSGGVVRRPSGQVKADSDPAPSFGPTKRLDYELEVGAYIGPGNALGSEIPVTAAEDHLFGLCLVNDWSARDIQAWEYQPLGPFLAKNFATTVSPWVVTLEALAPFRAPAFRRSVGDPAPLPYLHAPENEDAGGIDIRLSVWLRSERMRRANVAAERLSSVAFTEMYWTMAQLIAHHASNGCNLRSGDLIASGTVSGRTRESRGCLLELTWRGSEPIMLPTGEQRRFLEDGDEVIFRAHCEREGFRRIGFGECRGTVVGAVAR
ncbi:MAG: fumarylacetoacetate hydrolase [Geminicoccaceae bacterium]|nr:fumarylacetoacetate hydrolase [Geminicoccaceae bacterium]